jgi:uncharacterized protein
VGSSECYVSRCAVRVGLIALKQGLNHTARMVEKPTTAAPVPAVASSEPASLDALAAFVRNREAAPVHLWNPPYCGDIGLEIQADGTWSYQGSPIARRAMVELFASVLRKDEDGKTYLVTPAEKIDVRVADAPFLAVEMRIDGEGPAQIVRLRTNLDTWVPISSVHPVRFDLQRPSGGLKPYVLVRGRLEALLTRAVYLDLVMISAVDQTGQPGFWSSGIWWPLRA